jgi:hypothetical protein
MKETGLTGVRISVFWDCTSATGSAGLVEISDGMATSWVASFPQNFIAGVKKI